MPNLEAAAGCTRCNGTGEYHGTRRDGTSYISHCFACQGGGTFRRYGARRAYPTPAPAATVPANMGQTPQGVASWERFAAAMPAESAWLLADNSAFSQSLVRAVCRYGNLTPRQLACVQRNLPTVAHGPAVADTSAPSPGLTAEQIVTTVPMPSPGLTAEQIVLTSLIAAPLPSPVTVDATNIRGALLTARNSGLRKPRLTLGLFDFRLGRADIAARARTVYVYTRDNIRSSNWTYRAAINESGVVFFARGVSHMDDAQMALVRDACANPRDAAAAHGHDTTYCSCCRRLLTDPPSVMAGIGPVCIQRFGWL